MSTFNYIKLHAIGQIECIKSETKFELRDLQGHVGGLIDIVCIAPANGDKVGVDLVVHDEGLLQEDPQINLLATKICGMPIVGDVLLVGVNSEGESVGLPDRVFNLLSAAWEPYCAASQIQMYCEMGPSQA